MKKQLEEMQRYFENKILAGEFEVIKIDRHTADILIDGLSFSIWIADGFESVNTYNGNFNTIAIDFEDNKGVYNMLNEQRFSDANKSHIDAKTREFLALKKELGL